MPCTWNSCGPPVFPAGHPLSIKKAIGKERKKVRHRKFPPHQNKHSFSPKQNPFLPYKKLFSWLGYIFPNFENIFSSHENTFPSLGNSFPPRISYLCMPQENVFSTEVSIFVCSCFVMYMPMPFFLASPCSGQSSWVFSPSEPKKRQKVNTFVLFS